MSSTEQIYSLSSVRALALHAQDLTGRLDSEPAANAAAIADTVSRIGCVQIDTLHVVQRSHYLVLWSRLGCYDTRDLDRLVYGASIEGANDRRLFEDWLHAATILPLGEFRYRLPQKRQVRENTFPMSMHHWIDPASRAAFHASVLERIRQEGALRVSDFEYDGPKRGPWWDWKPAKRALENLFAWGDLMIAGRTNFQRAYDLTERVLPAWVDTREPTHAELMCHMVAEAVRTFGVCLPGQVGDYDYYAKITRARPFIEQLLAEGVLAWVQVALSDGRVQPMLVLREQLPLLEQAADGNLAAARTTFLSPFDNLFWPADRDRQFWGFTQRLEAYKPEAQREWGYFSMSVLHKDRFVGRFDPKLERASGTLRLKALYLEPGVELTGQLVADLAAAMRSFLAQHAARDLVIERSAPAEFGAQLLAAL